MKLHTYKIIIVLDYHEVILIMIFTVRLWVQEWSGYLHGESLEMVDRLEALGGEVLNEVLTAQTG